MGTLLDEVTEIRLENKKDEISVVLADGRIITLRGNGRVEVWSSTKIVGRVKF